MKNPTPGKLRLFALGAVLLSLVTVWVFYDMKRNAFLVTFFGDGIEAQGIIVNVEHRRTGFGTRVYFAEIQFTDRQNRQQVFTEKLGKTNPHLSAGDPVNVLYDGEGNDIIAMMDGDHNISIYLLVFMALGVLFVFNYSATQAWRQARDLESRTGYKRLP